MSTDFTLCQQGNREFFVDENSERFSLVMMEEDICWISISELTLSEFKAIAQRMLEIASYHE